MGRPFGERSRAIIAGLSLYFTGRPCRHGHVSDRLVSGGCVECVHIRSTKAKVKRRRRGALPGLRAAAAKLGLRTYFTGRPCSKGHISERETTSGSCCVCRKILRLAEYHRNKSMSTRRAYIPRKREISRNWAFRNKPHLAAKERRRHAGKIYRTVAWADERQIAVFYKVAAALSRRDGILYHVDHVIPLQGKTVSGLHVHYNLAVIPAIDNIKKGNRFLVA